MSKKSAAEAEVEAEKQPMAGKSVDLTGASPSISPENIGGKTEPVADPTVVTADPTVHPDPDAIPPTTGQLSSDNDELAKRLRTLVEAAGAEIRLHGAWQMRVVLPDGSSELVTPLPTGDLQILETRNASNAIEHTKGPTIMKLSTFVETIKSAKALYDQDQRHNRNA